MQDQPKTRHMLPFVEEHRSLEISDMPASKKEQRMYLNRPPFFCPSVGLSISLLHAPLPPGVGPPCRNRSPSLAVRAWTGPTVDALDHLGVVIASESSLSRRREWRGLPDRPRCCSYARRYADNWSGQVAGGVILILLYFASTVFDRQCTIRLRHQIDPRQFCKDSESGVEPHSNPQRERRRWERRRCSHKRHSSAFGGIQHSASAA
ncbi:hypothetical protein DFH06DRAFT_1177463 [Mycena polygramma]|nr:hypothetical protein DFH06DRAFT_1177463 [Mycena polygramma]